MTADTGYEPLYELKRVARNLWIADGGWIRFYGMPFPTRMTVIRLADGSIWVHSPIADEAGLGGAVAALGPVRHLVAPNWIHYAWLTDWQKRFPDALTWACPGVVERAASRGLTLAPDRLLDDRAPGDWVGQMDQRIADSGFHREVVFFHRPSRTLVLTDLIENLEAAYMPWWSRPLLRLGGVRHPDGRMPLDIRLSFRRRSEHLRDIVDTMIGWAPERVLFAHGKCFDSNGAAELKRAFRRD